MSQTTYTKLWLIIFLLSLSIPMTKPHFCFQNLLQNVFWLEHGANLGYNHDITSLYDLCRNKVFAQAKLSLPRQRCEIAQKYRKNSV